MCIRDRLFMIDTSATGMKGDDAKLPAMLSEVEQKVKQIPGVQAASFAFIVFNQGFWSGPAYTREDGIPEGQNRSLRNNIVGPDFFAAMGIPFVQGRGFGPQDIKTSQTVSYTHLRAHETPEHLVCRLLLEK